MQPGERQLLARTFDADAEGYDRARPGYPPQLFADVVALTGLRAGDSVVEVGSGTGKATVPLVQLGCRVVGVEPGPALAAVARRNLLMESTVDFVVSTFEHWRPDGRYDMVFAATSWHWVDPATRYAKAAEVLRPGGTLAIVTTHHVAPSSAGDPFFVAVQPVYEAIGEAVSGGPPPPSRVSDLAGEMAATGLFTPVGSRRYLWESSYTVDEYLDVLNTYSGHRAMTRHTRAYLFEQIRQIVAARSDQRIRKHYLFVLTVGRRAAEPG